MNDDIRQAIERRIATAKRDKGVGSAAYWRTVRGLCGMGYSLSEAMAHAQWDHGGRREYIFGSAFWC